MPSIILSNAQLSLIQKAFSNTKTSKFTKNQKIEMIELSDCLTDIIKENDEEKLYDLDYGSDI